MGFHLFTPDHVVQSYRGPQGVMRIISWNNANASSWGGFDTGAPENLKKKALPHQVEVVRKVRALARRHYQSRQGLVALYYKVIVIDGQKVP